MVDVMNVSIAPLSLAIGRVLAAGCFAGVILFTGNPTAFGETPQPPERPAVAVEMRSPASTSVRPAAAAAERPAISVSVTALDLSRLGPDAFADWSPSDQ